MLTIGQLARYVGVSVKTIRVYHAKGLLPEPRRDASGYRRYSAQDAIELIRVRTLAEAGMPLARIRELRATPGAGPAEVVRQIDAELAARITALRNTRRRLRRLAAGEEDLLPTGVAGYLDRLRAYGFSADWVALQADLWTLVFATHPQMAAQVLQDQAQAVEDPLLRQVFLDYDRARELEPDDPRLDRLAGRMVAATRARYAGGSLPGQDVASDIPELIQRAVNSSSPAWRRIDELVRGRLAAEH